MKSIHFILIKTYYPLEKLAELNVAKIFRLHDVPLSIISNRDPRFNFRFWGKLHETLDRRLVRMIDSDTRGHETFLPLADFSYNNNYQTSIKMAPFEALYGSKCRTPLYKSKLSERNLVETELIRETKEKKSYVDLKRKGIEFQTGDQLFLKFSSWKNILRFGKKGKLSPGFIGPYEIRERVSPLQLNFSYSEELVKILAQEVKELRNK
ncbi:Integrase, catalytic core [Gossypium australe]|uniref:Integrase, catalytic core n=1 Tax=Gossypium australe TaxID=47621 RepID=A0A5B6WSI3_9ROSI|nr:Integrase, catalytic core [Gossypium australe]